jgi:hypothetical protein
VGQAVFLLYFGLVGFVFVPYYNWQYAREHGFVDWLFFGEIVPTAKAAVWPYFVFLSKGDDQTHSLGHLRKSIEYRNEAVRMVNKGSRVLYDQDMQRPVALVRQALAEARLVDAEVLDRRYEDFASHFRDEYLRGLQLFIESFEQGDTLKSLDSRLLLRAWGNWYQSNLVKHAEEETPSPNAAPDDGSAIESPPATADELDRYSRVMAKIDKVPLTDADLAEVRRVNEDYIERTGYRMGSGEYEESLLVMDVLCEYMYELGQSLLTSWDRKERFTTARYETLSRWVAKTGVRRPEKLAGDKACLEAASRNQPYVQDEQGQMYEFGREVILSKIREDGIMRANLDKLAKVWDEMVR